MSNASFASLLSLPKQRIVVNAPQKWYQAEEINPLVTSKRFSLMNESVGSNIQSVIDLKRDNSFVDVQSVQSVENCVQDVAENSIALCNNESVQLIEECDNTDTEHVSESCHLVDFRISKGFMRSSPISILSSESIQIMPVDYVDVDTIQSQIDLCGDEFTQSVDPIVWDSLHIQVKQAMNADGKRRRITPIPKKSGNLLDFFDATATTLVSLSNLDYETCQKVLFEWMHKHPDPSIIESELLRLHVDSICRSSNLELLQCVCKCLQWFVMLSLMLYSRHSKSHQKWSPLSNLVNQGIKEWMLRKYRGSMKYKL